MNGRSLSGYALPAAIYDQSSSLGQLLMEKPRIVPPRQIAPGASEILP